MAALVKVVAAQDFTAAKVPALFWYSKGDTVVRPEVTARIHGEWGGPATVEIVTPGAGDDPNQHVIAGDILSPGLTEKAVEAIKQWKFEPALKNGEPIAVLYNLTINFQLSDEEPHD